MRRLLVGTCLSTAALVAAGSTYANEELIKLSQDPKQWVTPAGNYANTRHSMLKQITADNVGKLQAAWTFSTGVLRGHEGAPLVVGDVMYLHGPFPNSVSYALNLADENKIIWKYEPVQDPTVIPVMCCDTVNRGLSYADGKIFLSQADTTLAVALDAKTGKVVWSQKNGDPQQGAPRRPAHHEGQGPGRHVRRLQGHLPGSARLKDEQPAAYRRRRPACSTCRRTMSAWTTSRSGSAIRRASPMSARRSPCIRRPGETNMGNFIAWDAKTGKIVWSNKEQFSVWSGALSTAGDVVFYGTLEGYLKAVDAKTGKELYKFKTPSGIIGNVMTYELGGKQYVAVLSGVGGWAGIGLAAGLTNPQRRSRRGRRLRRPENYTSLGGQLTVFALPAISRVSRHRHCTRASRDAPVASVTHAGRHRAAALAQQRKPADPREEQHRCVCRRRAGAADLLRRHARRRPGQAGRGPDARWQVFR